MARGRVLSTAQGTRPEAFGPAEWGLLSAVALMWGSSFLWIDIGPEAFRPPVIAVARIVMGALALGFIRRSRTPVAREDWPRVVLLAFVWTAIPLLLFPIAQDVGLASSSAGMINGAMPLFAALFLRRLPGPLQALGLLVGFAGVVLVSLSSAGGAGGTVLGTALALVATVLYGLAANIMVPLQQKYGALPVIVRAQLVALAAVLPFGIAAVPDSRWAWPSALAMVMLGVFGTGLAYVASSTLLGRAGPTRGSVQIYFIPVVALIIVGAYLTSRRERPADTGAPAPVEGLEP